MRIHRNLRLPKFHQPVEIYVKEIRTDRSPAKVRNQTDPRSDFLFGSQDVFQDSFPALPSERCLFCI